MSIEPLEVPQLAGSPPRHLGVFRAQVTNVADPLQMGRVAVSVPAVLGDGQSVWAVPCTGFTAPGAGVRFVPQVGDAALVAFEAGDPRFPVVLGYFWGPAQAPPPVSHVLRGRGFAELEIVDLPPAVRLSNAISSIAVEDAAVTVTVGASSLRVTPTQIELVAQSVSIAASDVEVRASNVSVEGGVVTVDGTVTSVSGTTECSISGALVRIN